METIALFEILQKGGLLLFVILGMGVFAVGVFLERWFFYRQESLNVAEFLKGIVSLVRRKHFAEALDRCDEAHGPAVQIVRAALEFHKLPRAELRDILSEVAAMQLPRLERHLFLLSAIAILAPLMGLLGTVLGMMDTFITMETSRGAATSASLAGGVWEALLTSAAGLLVATVATGAHQLLLAHVRQFCDEMSRASVEMMHALAQAGRVIDFNAAQSQTATFEEPAAKPRRKQ
jgi:biopolymer transport protein ExbB